MALVLRACFVAGGRMEALIPRRRFDLRLLRTTRYSERKPRTTAPAARCLTSSAFYRTVAIQSVGYYSRPFGFTTTTTTTPAAANFYSTSCNTQKVSIRLSIDYRAIMMMILQMCRNLSCSFMNHTQRNSFPK